ncbi:MAG: LysR family transcriptional regulator [Myxococcota bacterium]
MELHQVRYFLAVFETRNFTRAAEHSHVSQPALTKAIKKLEEELGGPLFHRERSGAKLTTLGEMVLPRFMRLAEESASIREIAQNHQLLRKVPVRVGVLCTIGPHQLARYLDVFHRQAPHVEVEIRVMRQGPLIKRLEDAELEIAIGNADLATQPWLVVRRLYLEQYMVALPPAHPLTGRTTIALSDLHQQPYIDRMACELRDVVAEASSSRGVELYATYRSDREAWIECLVRAGIGVALLPEHSIVSDDTIRRPLEEPVVTRTIALMRSADNALSPAAKTLWQTLTSQANS